MTRPEAAPHAEWQLDTWFRESLGLVTNKNRDTLRAYFLVGEEDHASYLLQLTCKYYEDETISFISINLSDPNLTVENLHKALGIKSHRYHKAKPASKRKCVFFRNMDKATLDFRKAMIGLAKNRRCGPMYFPPNWLAFIHMPTEEAIVQLLPTKMLLDASWIAVTVGTDVGSVDAQEIMGVKIDNKTKDAGGHYGPRGPTESNPAALNLYYKKKSLGLCTRCSNKRARPNRITCTSCADKAKNRRRSQ